MLWDIYSFKLSQIAKDPVVCSSALALNNNYLVPRIAPCQLMLWLAERPPKERVATASISTFTPGLRALLGIGNLPKARINKFVVRTLVLIFED